MIFSFHKVWFKTIKMQQCKVSFLCQYAIIVVCFSFLWCSMAAFLSLKSHAILFLIRGCTEENESEVSLHFTHWCDRWRWNVVFRHGLTDNFGTESSKTEKDCFHRSPAITRVVFIMHLPRDSIIFSKNQPRLYHFCAQSIPFTKNFLYNRVNLSIW